jgi:hypothetical protein
LRPINGQGFLLTLKFAFDDGAFVGPTVPLTLRALIGLNDLGSVAAVAASNFLAFDFNS